MKGILRRALACVLGALLAFTGVSLPDSISNLFSRGITAAEAENITEDRFTYYIEGNTAVIDGYSGSQTEIAIPAQVNGLPVTGIGIQAFFNRSDLKSVIIPPGITSIGDSAFSGCSHLKSVALPESVASIGNFAFHYCINLTSIVLPGGVTSIGRDAFHNCKSLISITIPEGVTNIGDMAFYDCTSLLSITIPESVTSIGKFAFYGCSSLSSATIPENVVNIGDFAFGDTPFAIQNQEMKELINKYKNTFDIFPAEYPSIFNMVIQYHPSSSWFSLNGNSDNWFLLAKINGKRTIMPVRSDWYFSDLQGNPIDMNPIYSSSSSGRKKENERVTRLKKIVQQNRLKLYDPHNDSIFVIEFFSPGLNDSLPIGVWLNKQYFYGNEEFFSNDEYVEIMNLYRFENLLDYFSIDISQIDLSPEMIEICSKNENMSVEQFYEFYMKMIPKDYWPIITISEVNVNITLPKLKDEILDQKINSEIGLCKINTVNGINYILIKHDKEKGLFNDFFNGEEVSDGITEPNKDYLDIFDVTQGTYDYFFSSINIRENIVFAFERNFPHLMDEFMLAKTNRDLVTWYQKIPLENQINYSIYDFSKSPIKENIDPAWLANRPTPPPSPTPSPYAELRVGSQGQEVLDMKQRFFELGYFRTDQFSDQFNANTVDTVKQFEKNNGLKVDGVADAVMLGVLFSEKAVGK